MGVFDRIEVEFNALVEQLKVASSSSKEELFRQVGIILKRMEREIINEEVVHQQTMRDKIKRHRIMIAHMEALHQATKLGKKLKDELEGMDVKSVKAAAPSLPTDGLSTEEALDFLMGRDNEDKKKERELKEFHDAIRKAEKDKDKARRKSQKASREG